VQRFVYKSKNYAGSGKNVAVAESAPQRLTRDLFLKRFIRTTVGQYFDRY